MGYDEIEIEILADGTIKSTTDRVSAENHSSADGFFRLLKELSGGDVQKQKRSVHHHHEHVKEKVKERQPL